MISNIKTFFNYITVFLLLAITLYRFRIKIPREIFENTTIVYFVVYISVVLINICLLISVCLKHLNYKANVNKNTVFIKFALSVKSWIDVSYKTFMDNVANISGYFCDILAFITHYFVKIPLRVFSLTSYVTKISLILALSYDVLVLEKFMYFYYMTYLLLILLIIKTVLYISIEINERILEECLNSIVIINYSQVFDSVHSKKHADDSHFILSEKNKQFSSVKDARGIGNVVSKELDLLNLIKNTINECFMFQVVIRLCYILIFSYIIYFYPINIFTPL